MSNDGKYGSVTLSSEERLIMLNQISQAKSVLTLITSDCEDGRSISGVETLSNAACCANNVLTQLKDRLSA